MSTNRVDMKLIGEAARAALLGTAAIYSIAAPRADAKEAEACYYCGYDHGYNGGYYCYWSNGEPLGPGGFNACWLTYSITNVTNSQYPGQYVCAYSQYTNTGNCE